MKERGVMLAVSILLVYSAGTLAIIFWQVYFLGVALVEPNRVIIFNEMVLAGLFTLVGLAGFVVALWNTLKRKGE